MSRLPIRVRLTLVFALVMAVMLTLLGAFLYFRLQASLDEQIADDLEARGAALATGVDPSLLAGEEGIARWIDPDTSGQVTLATPRIRVVLITTAELVEVRSGSVVDVERDGFRLRSEAIDGSVVVVGKSLEDRDEALDALLTQLLIALPLALLVASGVGYLVAAAALRPMEEMRREAEAISSSSSERRLPLPTADDEVRRLGETLNEMLGRLDAGLARERQFVADASHELRTPLAILKAELELALRQPRSAQELAAALGSALEETERLARLAEELLLVARADQGVLHVQPARLRVDELLERVAQRFRGAAGARAIEVDSPALELDADGTRLEQAVANLVDNAIRHGAGRVTILAVECGGSVELHVTDEGAGFDPGFVAVAFERFSRSDTARSSDGTGLGLAIVQAIAHAHGGSVGAHNREVGGADVWLAVPSGLNAEHAPRGDRIGVD